MKSIFLLLAPIAAFFPACSTTPQIPAEIQQNLGRVGVSTPAAGEKAQGLESVVIVGSNDIHGALAPLPLKPRENEGVPAVEYQAGGMSYLISHIRILQSQFGSNLLWLDGGDEFQGSIESNTGKGAPMVRVFNVGGLHGAAIGNHEFDFGADDSTPSDLLSSLKARMREAHYPYLSANIFAKGTDKLAEFPNTLPSKLYSVGRLSVGVIGLTTLETPSTTRSIFVKNLEFRNLKEATLREATKLRSQGAQIIVVTAHVGLACQTAPAPAGNAIRKEADLQGKCAENGELVELLNSLPEGTVDAAVSGHSHQLIHHWINGVPTIQGGASGRYLNVLYLTYDWNQRKLLHDHTRIEGPIPICPAVFQNQNDCNGDRPAPGNGRGALVPPSFHGRTIYADAETNRSLEEVFKKSAEIKNQILGQAARPIEHQRFKESELGNLVSDAIRLQAKADLAIMNPGGIRANIESGTIKYDSVFRALPFDNSIALVKLTGTEVKTLLRIVESGSRGFFSVSGVELRLIALESEAPATDLNQSGKIDPWEINRLLEARLSDGSPIVDSKLYTLATLDFLVTGGDDLAWFFSKIPASRIELNSGVVVREAVVTYTLALAKAGPINAAEHPLVDKDHPRLRFEKIAVKKEKKRSRRKSKGSSKSRRKN
ncbi:bifunctional UDP-sugar hydrolase/5'-nucleotidase [Bdellovibrionota bacterium FG-2]